MELFYFAVEFQKPKYEEPVIGFWRLFDNINSENYKIPDFGDEANLNLQTPWRIAYGEIMPDKDMKDIYKNIELTHDLTPQILADRIYNLLEQFSKIDLKKKS